MDPSFALYSSFWFMVPKKNGSLNFIKNMQPIKVIIIRNKSIRFLVDESIKAFARRIIYLIGDIYLDHN